MRLVSGLIVGFVAISGASEASMSGRTLEGNIFDNRIVRCGVMVEDGAFSSLRPFIETSEDLTGSYKLIVGKISTSGRSTTVQSNRFNGRSLGTTKVMLNAPAKVAIDFNVVDANGKMLCQLETMIELKGSPVKT